MSPRDVVVVGGGHNALVCAFDLARAGHKPLVLERHGHVGGALALRETASGARGPALAHADVGLAESIATDLQLERHGLSWLDAVPARCALDPDGRALLLSPDPRRLAASLERFSTADAAAYPRWTETLQRLAATLVPLAQRPPADLDAPGIRDLWGLAAAGLRYRRLGRRRSFELLRWPPMPVADLVQEWFETPLLQAAIAGRAIFGSFAGPREAGTTTALLFDEALALLRGLPPRVPRGGVAALAGALGRAAAAAGAEIRTGSDVTSILTDNGQACGVALADGKEIRARIVVSGVAPKRTLLDLVDPAALDPEVAWRVRNIRSRGTLAKVEITLDALPPCPALWTETGRPASVDPAGRVHIGPSLDYLQRAFDGVKYGRLPDDPWLELSVPALADPSLAEPDRHLLSVHVQHVPPRPREGTWPSRRAELVSTVMRTLSRYLPGLSDRVIDVQVFTPDDLEAWLGTPGGHIFHAEPALDQLFIGRPLLGWARYKTPVPRLYVCSAGTHPGLGVSGLPGRLAARAVLSELGVRS